MSSRKACPHCKTKTLKSFEYHGQQVERCSKCAGVWFEKGELDQSLTQAAGSDDERMLEQRRMEKASRTELKCPECSKNMHRQFLLEGYEVEVELCVPCGGFWVEGDELQHAHDASHLADHLEQLNQKPDWKAFIFQMLTTLPKEYNLKVSRTPLVTWFLVAINVAVYLLQISVDYGVQQVMIYEGALFAQRVSNGEGYAGLFTHMFMHADLIHLVSNMYFLWIIGDNLEDVLGHYGYLAAYLFCGLAAALVQVVAMPDSVIPMVGASGAIAGLFGMYLLWFRSASLTFLLFFWQIKLEPSIFFLIWVGFNMIGMLINEQGVAHMAHLGGIGAGLLLGLVLQSRVYRSYPVLAMLNRPHINISR